MSGDASARRFARLAAAFDRAWRAAPAERNETHYVLAGVGVRMRIAGNELARHVDRAIAHARPSGSRPPAVLAIDLWDARRTAVPGLEHDAAHADGSSWRIGSGIFAASHDARVVSHALGSAVVWLDRQSPRMVGWYADGNDVSLHQRGKPLQMLLAVWSSDRGLLAVHAACIARGDAGVLIPGRSGAGKSTTALACMHAGFDYLGDDWIGIAEPADGTARGYGLYSSTFLDPEHATRFPRAAGHLIAPSNPGEEKSLLFVGDLFPQQLRGDATIRALALPRLVSDTAVRVRPAAKRDALLTLVPSSVFEMHPRSGRAGVDRLARLVEEVPAYWLELGSDIAAIVSGVERILQLAARR